MIASDNFHKPRIEETNASALGLVDKLTANSRIRKQRLHENLARIQFYWRCEMIETWIVQKEETLRTSENIASVSSLVAIRQLIVKHQSFSSSLEAFENEAIRPIFDLRWCSNY